MMTTHKQKPTALVLYLEKDLMDLVCDILEDAEYETQATPRAEDVLDILHDSTRPYVVLADNVHASKEAYLLCHELQADPSLRRRVKVLALTAFDYRRQPNRPALSEIDGHVPLPFEADELIDVVELASRQLQDGAGNAAPNI